MTSPQQTDGATVREILRDVREGIRDGLREGAQETAAQAPATGGAFEVDAGALETTGAVQTVRLELRGQLTQLRRDITTAREELGQLSGTGLAAAQARIAGMEGRAIVLEQQIARLDQRLVELLQDEAPATTAGTAPPFIPVDPNRAIPSSDQIVAIVALVFVGMPFAIGLSRWLWRAADRVLGRAPVANTQDLERRVATLQQSVDAIAVEIERVSEGQRFVTKALGVGAAQPVAAAAPAEAARPPR